MLTTENKRLKRKYVKKMLKTEKRNLRFLTREKSVRLVLMRWILCKMSWYRPKKIWQSYKAYCNGEELKKYIDNESIYENEDEYFCDDRIAVYTCIINNYDIVQEPQIRPDNIDYYIITDANIPPSSAWKKIDIEKYKDNIKGLSPAETNRFFKMNPYILFCEYKYSIYVDGTIKIISDLTKYINRLGKHGLSLFRHPNRNDVFQEAIYCVTKGKESKALMKKHIKHIIDEKMPRNYGLVDCTIIVRDNSKECRMLMKQWWKEYRSFSKRDQVSLPYVLWKNGIRIEEVATLGNNLSDDPTIRKVSIHI